MYLTVGQTMLLNQSSEVVTLDMVFEPGNGILFPAAVPMTSNEVGCPSGAESIGCFTSHFREVYSL